MKTSYDINIDITKFGLSINDLVAPKVVDAIQTAITNSLAVIRDKWVSEAQAKLKSSRPLYLLGLDFNSVIYPYGGDALAGAVELHGRFPNMIEKGFPAFDEKTGFSKSPRKVPTKSGGWYLTIPMRHSIPNSFMYGPAMPKDIYNQAKKLKNGQSLKIKGETGTSWNGYVHKSNNYSGLTRIIKSYNGKSQSQYMTFRRVSDKSDPMSWWHPGYVGIKLAQKLMPFAYDTFQYNLNLHLSKLNGV